MISKYDINTSIKNYMHECYLNENDILFIVLPIYKSECIFIHTVLHL